MYTKNHLKHISFELYNPISKKLLYGPTVPPNLDGGTLIFWKIQKGVTNDFFAKKGYMPNGGTAIQKGGT